MGLLTPKQLTVPLAAVSLLLLGLGVSGGWYALRLQTRTAEVLEVNVAGIRAGEELELQVRDLRHKLDRVMLSGDAAQLKAALVHRDPIYHWLHEAERAAVKQEEILLVARIRRALEAVFRELDRVVSEGSEINEATLDQFVQNTLSGQVLIDARRYLDVNEQELERNSNENQKMSERLILGLFLLGTCGAIAGLVAGYGVARGIGRAMVQLSVPIRDVAGKLNEVVGPVSISTDPEFHDLGRVLQQVSGEVDRVVRRLHESHREVMRADQLAAVGQLAAGLAHELRNPLMCIKVLVQSAQQRTAANGLLDGEDLAMLETEVRRLEDLLQTFLDFARPAQLDRRPIDIRRVAERTAGFLRGRANRRNVEIRFAEPDHPVLVDADEGQIRQVLLNLLLNALDAIGSGGVIEVTVAREGADNQVQPPWALLCVQDDGPGLPKDSRSRLFEPFFSTKETGIGLGLAICKRIVESHGGQITASDAPSGGAIFTVRVPAISTVGQPCAQPVVQTTD